MRKDIEKKQELENKASEELSAYRKKIYERFVETGVYDKECELAFGSYDVICTDKEEELLSKGIEDLDLSVRSYNCLRRAGIVTIKDLISETDNDIIKCRNLGRKSYMEIKIKLNELGLDLLQEEE